MRSFCYDKYLLDPLPPDWEEKMRQLRQMDAWINARSPFWKQARTEQLYRELMQLPCSDCCRAWEALPTLAAAPFTEQTLLTLHALLMPDVPPGYKQDDNIILYRVDGEIKGVVFIPPDAEETPAAMTALMDAFQTWKRRGGLPILGMLGCFLQDFLCIHPFSDGNGRMTRLLLVLLLLRMGFSGAQYLAPECYVREVCHRTAMLKAQHSSMQLWYEGRNDYRPAATFWLETILDLYREALEQKD